MVILVIIGFFIFFMVMMMRLAKKPQPLGAPTPPRVNEPTPELPTDLPPTYSVCALDEVELKGGPKESIFDCDQPTPTYSTCVLSEMDTERASNGPTSGSDHHTANTNEHTVEPQEIPNEPCPSYSYVALDEMDFMCKETTPPVSNRPTPPSVSNRPTPPVNQQRTNRPLSTIIDEPSHSLISIALD